MNLALWILAGLLAVAFFASGLSKIVGTRDQMITKTPYVEDFPQGAVRLIGLVEVLGALGLVLPALLDVAPALVPTAAIGLALVMIGAAVVHLRRGDDVAAAVPALVLALLSAVVAWGRLGSWAF
ncbi:DoxX protein [Sanguibacter keddieii DSM 10542]|uniref:DoxX protein n=1 Tax=Sanguibacter keddieii (strain ATCC 51767 / DSM 10542 / NCFB 3025 / ST-74) TaxID=446469 RepID=D1BDS4_SANKS|nr:DoxX family protein [Sanguibacter keddieii]ACZ21136.1 DoxX protein [Sanguibacter keddieii DSM 10542]